MKIKSLKLGSRGKELLPKMYRRIADSIFKLNNALSVHIHIYTSLVNRKPVRKPKKLRDIVKLGDIAV